MERKDNYAFVAIGVTGVALNSLEMIMILKGGQYRVPFQMSVLSLAVADFLTSLTVAICSVLIFSLKIGSQDYQMAESFYILVVIFSTISSQLHVIFITIQRLIAVLFPFNCKRIMTSFRCGLMLALIWVLSLVVTGLIKYMFFAVNALTIVSGVVIGFSYILIVYRIRNRPITSNRDSTKGLDLILYSGILFILFVACYFPFTIYTFIKGYKTDNGPWIIIYYMYWLNIVTNPLVYFLFKMFKGGAGKCCKTHQTSGTIQDTCPR